MKDCPYLLVSNLERRPLNALCLEITTPIERCKLKTPEEWVGLEPEEGPSLADRWVRSGGSYFVFGACDCQDPETCPELGK